MKIIAVEEHLSTEAFLRTAHALDVIAGDEAEMALMRAVEESPGPRARLVVLDARLREMDAAGQEMAVLSLNPP
ncbi:MAG TPA: amidohydrolase, partial [Amycolatopsis sp.]